MEYKQFLQTSGHFKGQEMTLLTFADGETEHLNYFRRIMRVLCDVEPGLTLNDFGNTNFSVNRSLGPEELAQLTNGCPDIHYQDRKKFGLAINPKFL